MKHRLTAAILFLFILGCSSSKITSSWKAEQIQPKKYNKVMVVGLIRDADLSIREKMEAHFVGDLSSLGYKAITSQSVLGNNSLRGLGKDSAAKYIKSFGVDAVITIVLLDKSLEQVYVSQRLPLNPNNQNQFGNYYSEVYGKINSPGYYVTDTKYFWQSNFYDIDTRQLLYTVKTESFSPASSEALGHEYGKMIVKDMTDKQVLIKR